MTQVTQNTSVDYSQDGLHEHFKKNKLIHKQDSEINPFAPVPPAATDATNSQHLFVLFLNACSRGMILSTTLHISIVHSTFLQTTIPAMSSLPPPLHIRINCVAHQFHKAKFHPCFPHHLHLHLSINISVDSLIPLITAASVQARQGTL